MFPSHSALPTSKRWASVPATRRGASNFAAQHALSQTGNSGSDTSLRRDASQHELARRRSIAAALAGTLAALGLKGKARGDEGQGGSQRRRRIAVITGANSGIGLATATELALRGWDVVPACRLEDKARLAASRISAAVPNARVRCLEAKCDLADLRSVASFGATLRRELGDTGLDALVLNAGIDGAPLTMSKQGLELHFAVNHLGHFGLWRSCSPLLEQALAQDDRTSPRVVSVTSSAALDAEMILGDLTWEWRKFTRREAYAQSKACNVLFSEELARRYATAAKSSSRFVRSHVVDPGPTATQIVRYKLPKRAAQRLAMSPEQVDAQARNLKLNTPAEGASGPVWLADSEQAGTLNGGWWIGPGLQAPPVELEWRSKPMAYELWAISEDLIAPYIAL